MNIVPLLLYRAFEGSCCSDQRLAQPEGSTNRFSALFPPPPTRIRNSLVKYRNCRCHGSVHYDGCSLGSLVEVYRRFRSPSSGRWRWNSGTFINYRITRRYNPDDSHLQFKNNWQSFTKICCVNTVSDTASCVSFTNFLVQMVATVYTGSYIPDILL
jgi:hypothetical protein